MLGWIFGGLVKKFEVAARKVSQDFVKDAGKEIGQLFDNKLYPLADRLDYITQQRIGEVEELEEKTKIDIKSLLDNADNKVKQSLEEINQIREDAIRDLGKATGEKIQQADKSLENRINQLSLALMEALSSTSGIANNALLEINRLENQLFQDANQIVDKIDEVLEGKFEQIRNELKKYLAHALPNPIDKCRRRLKIGLKFGGMLSDIELYELTECYKLSELDANTSIDKILLTYGELQLNAARMSALVKNSPELKRRAIEDWIKYGVLCAFWRNTMESYDRIDPILKLQMAQQILTDRVD